MGGGSWTTHEFCSYSSSRGRSTDSSGRVTTSYDDVSQAYTQKNLHDDLNPRNIIRECCDSTEHPATIPIILGLDVTGSMGSAAIEVSKKLNVLMTNLLGEIKDVQFSVMGIGDLYCDSYPIQMSQFESDTRIAENLDKIYFEMGGGGNAYESYTSAWYMGLKHTKLDAWNRGAKGIIITIGDEEINPYLPVGTLKSVTGDKITEDVDTKALYNEVKEKFDVYHVIVRHGCPKAYYDKCQDTFVKVIGENNVKNATVNNVVDVITDIIKNNVGKETLITEAGDAEITSAKPENEISW